MRNDHSRLVFSIVAGSECYLRESPVLEHPERSRSILDKVHLGAAGVLFIDNRLPVEGEGQLSRRCRQVRPVFSFTAWIGRCGNERPFVHCVSEYAFGPDADKKV